MQVWNPAFDVTPSSLIQGIITEHGLIQQHEGSIDVNGFLKQQGLLDLQENGDIMQSPYSACGDRVAHLSKYCASHVMVPWLMTLSYICKNAVHTRTPCETQAA